MKHNTSIVFRNKDTEKYTSSDWIISYQSHHMGNISSSLQHEVSAPKASEIGELLMKMYCVLVTS